MNCCIVYENKYIDCTIDAPIMVSAIVRQDPYHFDFMELNEQFVIILFDPYKYV